MGGLLVAGLTFAVASAAWGGLGWLLTNIPPSRPLAVLAAYVFAFAAVTSTASFLLWLALRPRTTEEPPRLKSPAGYVPHAMLLAVIILFGVWLQSVRSLTPIVAVLLIGLYAFLELAVQFGTRGSVELPVRR